MQRREGPGVTQNRQAPLTRAPWASHLAFRTQHPSPGTTQIKNGICEESSIQKALNK